MVSFATLVVMILSFNRKK
ncbi:hypothetical protein [Dehalobacter sp. DCM]